MCIRDRFIIGIGWTLDDGYPHELRAADYDDWVTPTTTADGQTRHGLNGDILVWNPVTRRRHELSSMGVRVDAASLRQQLELTGSWTGWTCPTTGDRGRHPAAVDRWWHRPVSDADAAAAQGPPRRGQRDGLAAGPQGHVRGTGHPRARVSQRWSRLPAEAV